MYCCSDLNSSNSKLFLYYIALFYFPPVIIMVCLVVGDERLSGDMLQARRTIASNSRRILETDEWSVSTSAQPAPEKKGGGRSSSAVSRMFKSLPSDDVKQ